MDRKAQTVDRGYRGMMAQGRFGRVLLVSLGMLLVALGLIGAFVPVLPTTPFLLLAAACFVRSSDRMHRWLFTNRVFGGYLRGYREGKGMPLAYKVGTLALLWITLAVSAFAAVPADRWWARGILLIVGVGVTIHILCIKTRRGAGSR